MCSRRIQATEKRVRLTSLAKRGGPLVVQQWSYESWRLPRLSYPSMSDSTDTKNSSQPRFGFFDSRPAPSSSPEGWVFSRSSLAQLALLSDRGHWCRCDLSLLVHFPPRVAFSVSSHQAADVLALSRANLRVWQFSTPVQQLILHVSDCHARFVLFRARRPLCLCLRDRCTVLRWWLRLI